MEELKCIGTGSRREKAKKDQEFIMLPTVDFCFKELMKNPKVRRGFIAALLKKEPEEVEETEILPGEQPGEYEDEKLGILDVLIRFSGRQPDESGDADAGVRLLEGEGSVLSLQDLYRAAEKGRKLRKSEEMCPCKRAGL